MPNTVVPLYIGCLTLPAFVVANTQDGIARSHDWMRLGLMPQFIVRQSLIIGFTAGAFALGFNLGATAAMLASAAAVWIAMIGQMIVLNRRLARPYRARPQGLRFPRLARGLAADPAGRELLSAAVLHRRAGAAAIPLLRRGRRLFRRGEDAGAGVLHSLRDVGDDGASLRRISRARRQGAAVGLCRACDQVDVLAVARRDHRAAGARQAAAVAVRAAIRRRLRHHVHRRHRPRGALGDRPGRAAAQHARPPAHLRAGLCAGVRHEPGAVPRCWCRASAATAPRPRPRSRWRSRRCCCSGSCGSGSGCTCWRSGSSDEA